MCVWCALGLQDVITAPCSIPGRSVDCSNHGVVNGCYCKCDEGWGGEGKVNTATNVYTGCWDEQIGTRGDDSVAVNTGLVKNSGQCFDNATCTMMVVSIIFLGMVAACCCACGLRNRCGAGDAAAVLFSLLARSGRPPHPPRHHQQ